ncbi:MAG: TIGR00282 family metallophosphoesterase [Syntrophomonadaceae bacterium]|nr:TIGR00282 family metallophosphoesterase [Syntrophomonadaceae bacterium]
MKVLVIGDIVGKPGRKAVQNLLPRIVKEHAVEFVIANAENAAGGKGVTGSVKDELLGAGVDVLTSGNHVWDNKAVFECIDDEPRLVRPANYPGECPGQGYHTYVSGGGARITVINLSGRVFMQNLDCPFREIDRILDEVQAASDVIIVDFHAEATSEKQAFAWYVDGRVSAVVGTHTHVQTSDERILPQGTAYITDVGMTGAIDSVLGMVKEEAISKFLTQRPVRLNVARGRTQLDAVLLEFNHSDYLVTRIQRLRYVMEGQW